MKKVILRIPFFLLLLFASQIMAIEIGGIQYKIDTLENHQIGPGTQYVSLRLTSTSRRLDVFFVISDLKNPYVDIRTVLGHDSIYSTERVSAMAKRKSRDGAFYFAGTNGDFFDIANQNSIGYPIGGSMVDGEIAKIPGSWNQFAIDDQKIPGIGHMTFTGFIYSGPNIWRINSVNHIRDANDLILYNRHNGKSTRTNEWGTEVLVELENGYNWGSNQRLKAKVLKIEKGIGSMAIPEGKAVLSGHGTAAAQLNQLAVNDVIDIALNLKQGANSTSNFVQIIGGDNYSTMLLNGVVNTSNFWNELHPRTGLGYSVNRDSLFLCVVDGRGVSHGATTKDLAQLMKSAGAYTAFNMDGGGSSAMYLAELGKPVNKVSDGYERAVGSSIYVVATSPTDNAIGIIKPHEKKVELPQFSEFIPQFYGYNQYEVLLDSDLQNVQLSCPESLGKIQGNRFIASGASPGNITATYNGSVTTTIEVSITPSTGIDADKRTGVSRVYPNPANDIIYVSIDDPAFPELKLYSLNGTLLKAEKGNQIGINEFVPGIYLLKVVSKDSAFNSLVVISR